MDEPERSDERARPRLDAVVHDQSLRVVYDPVSDVGWVVFRQADDATEVDVRDLDEGVRAYLEPESLLPRALRVQTVVPGRDSDVVELISGLIGRTGWEMLLTLERTGARESTLVHESHERASVVDAWQSLTAQLRHDDELVTDLVARNRAQDPARPHVERVPGALARVRADVADAVSGWRELVRLQPIAVPAGIRESGTPRTTAHVGGGEELRRAEWWIELGESDAIELGVDRLATVDVNPPEVTLTLDLLRGREPPRLRAFLSESPSELVEVRHDADSGTLRADLRSVSPDVDTMTICLQVPDA